MARLMAVLATMMLGMSLLPVFAQDEEGDPYPEDVAVIEEAPTATPAPTVTLTPSPVPTATVAACPAPGVRAAPDGTVIRAGESPASIAEGFTPGSSVRVTLVSPDGQPIIMLDRTANSACAVGAIAVPESGARGVYTMRWDGRALNGQLVELSDRFIVEANTTASSAPRAPSSCTAPPTMEIQYGTELGTVVQAQGFRPGGSVYVWIMRYESSISKPSRLPDLVWEVGDDCRVMRSISVQATGAGDRALYLAGPRYGGGSELTMWRKVELQLRQ